MFKLAAPTVATMTSYTLMQFADKLMVSRIDGDTIWVGAQGNGGLAAWVPLSIAMGVLFVVSSFVSQNLGAGKPERGAAYAWTGLWFSGAWALLLLPYAALLPQLFQLLGQDERRIELASTYGRILLAGAGLTLATRAISQYFYGMHRPWTILVAGLAANAVNLFLNWVLIYGNLGAPRLELVGAGIATVVAAVVELAIPLAVFLGPMNVAYRTRAAWRPSRRHFKELLRIGWPGGITFGNEMLCWSIFMVALVGRFGPQHSTAGWIAHQWMSLSFMPTVGISIAVTAMVGRWIGAGRPDIAARRAYLGLALALGYMLICAIAFVAFRAPMSRLFIDADTPPEAAAELVRLASAFLIATAAFQVFDAVAMTLSAALRGAGDTVWVGIVTMVLSWSIIVGGGVLLVTFAPSLGSLGPWIAAATYIALLAVAIAFRWRAGKWRRMSLVRADPKP